jgi:hypothetical protein
LKRDRPVLEAMERHGEAKRELCQHVAQAALCFRLFFSINSVKAQVVYGLIAGAVTDARAAVVPNAEVTAGQISEQVSVEASAGTLPTCSPRTQGV